MLTKVKAILLLLLAAGGVILFIFLAPFLMLGVWLLIWGLVAAMIFSFIIYAIWEWLRER